jgi:hypothetical protein
MARPLMQRGVGQLEEMFAIGRSDPKVLKQLENELQYRQVPRAVALLAEVKAALDGGSASPKGPTVLAPLPPIAPGSAPFPQQPNLWESPATPPFAAEHAHIPNRLITPAVKPQEAPAVVGAPASPHEMPLEVAYEVLRTKPGATWESIEETRRRLVQLAHPSLVASLSSEKKAQIRAEAAQVNRAYLRLSAARCIR